MARRKGRGPLLVILVYRMIGDGSSRHHRQFFPCLIRLTTRARIRIRLSCRFISFFQRTSKKKNGVVLTAKREMTQNKKALQGIIPAAPELTTFLHLQPSPSKVGLARHRSGDFPGYISTSASTNDSTRLSVHRRAIAIHAIHGITGYMV